MTLINAATLRNTTLRETTFHVGVPNWDRDAFDVSSLAAVPEPTVDDLCGLDAFDVLDEFDEFDEFDDVPRGSSYARCSDGNGTLSHLFFSDDDFDIARAKAICSKCGLRETCLGGALERGEVAGVWGGELVEDGAVVVLKRRRGRPPKVARPVLVVDEVPLPPHLVA
jgi:WhiB family transcriptional regulator, redox-sensing transcriptional regulator